MSKYRIGLTFSNGLGNLIIYSAVVKILRQRYPEALLELITDPQMLEKSLAIKDLIPYIFDSVTTVYNQDQYDEIIFSDWSLPRFVNDDIYKRRDISWRDGVHELDIYLNAIRASQSNFSGLIMPVADKPFLEVPSPRVVFANASKKHGSARGSILGWPYFPELSRILQNLGYNVVLVGQGDELGDCWGVNYINKLDIFQTAKVIQQCDLMVCTDTGLMHVADAVGTSILLLMGPSPITKSHPLVANYNVMRKYISCAPCYGSNLWRDCKSRECMSMISIEDVVRKVSKLMSLNRRAKVKDTDTKLDLLRYGGIGDVLASLPSIKALKDKDHKITFYTHWPEIVYNQPYVDELVKIDSITPNTVNMGYTLNDIRGGGSLSDVIARKLGVKLFNQYIPFTYSDKERELINKLKNENFVFISNQSSSNQWSTNQMIRDDIFLDIMKHLATKNIPMYLIGEIRDDLPKVPKGVVDLRGKTSLREAICYFQAARFAITLPAFWGNVHKGTQTPLLMLHSGYAHPDLLNSPWSVCISPDYKCDKIYCAIQRTRCKDWHLCQPNIDTILSVIDKTFLNQPKIVYALTFKDRLRMLQTSLESLANSKLIPGTFILYDDFNTDQQLIDFAKTFKMNSDMRTIYYKETNSHTPDRDLSFLWAETANRRIDLARKFNPDYIILMDDDCIYHPFWLQKLLGIFENDLQNSNVIAMSPMDIDHFDGHFDGNSYDIQESIYGGYYRFKGGFGGTCYVIPSHKLKDHGYFSGGDTLHCPQLVAKGFRFATLFPSMVQHLGSSISLLRSQRKGDIAWSF